MKVDRSTPPPVRPFATMTMPRPVVETLPNGIVFHHYRGGDQPVCRLTLHFGGGVAEMGEAVAKLLLSMSTEGTSTLSADDIAEAIDFNGARFTTQAQTHLCAVDMAVLTSRLTHILPLLEQIVTDPVFPDDRLEISKLKIKSALQVMRRDPGVVADQALMPLLLGNDNPLAHSMTEADIDSVSRQRLLECHKRLLCPGRMHAYLSGLFDDESLDAVSRFLGRLPGASDGYAMQAFSVTPAPKGSVATVAMPGILQSTIVCGIPTVNRSHPDYVPLRFAIMALGGYFGSRLMSNIREDKGLTYGINAALMGDRDRAHVYIRTQTDRGNADIVINEIRNELKNMVANPPQGEELERFRTYAMTGLAELLDNPASVMQYYMSQNIVGSPGDYFERQQQVLQSLDKAEIARVSKLYLDPDDLRIAIV